MDQNMPIMNGIQAAKQIRKMEKKKLIAEVKIIILSAQENQKFQELCKEAQVDFVL